jgi:hypothetical protein
MHRILENKFKEDWLMVEKAVFCNSFLPNMLDKLLDAVYYITGHETSKDLILRRKAKRNILKHYKREYKKKYGYGNKLNTNKEKIIVFMAYSLRMSKNYNIVYLGKRLTIKRDIGYKLESCNKSHIVKDTGETIAIVPNKLELKLRKMEKTAEKVKRIFDYHKKRIENEKLRKRRKFTGVLRMEILKRDNYSCQICGSTPEGGASLEVDHIQPYSMGGLTIAENARTLCKQCNVGVYHTEQKQLITSGGEK